VQTNQNKDHRAVQRERERQRERGGERERVAVIRNGDLRGSCCLVFRGSCCLVVQSPFYSVKTATEVEPKLPLKEEEEEEK
jgi:hypothetical protein